MIQDYCLPEFLSHFYCLHIVDGADQPSDDGRKRLFGKRISAEEMRKKTKEYQTFVLKDIFPEYELKEYMDRIKNILQKNGESEEVGDEFTGDGNSWFYTNGKDLHYFLEEDSDNKKVIKDEDNIKKQSCLNLGNSQRLESLR